MEIDGTLDEEECFVGVAQSEIGNGDAQGSLPAFFSSSLRSASASLR